MTTPKVGNRYWNLYNEVHKVTDVADDGSELTAVNEDTDEEETFKLIKYTNIAWYYKEGYGISKISLGEQI